MQKGMPSAHAGSVRAARLLRAGVVAAAAGALLAPAALARADEPAGTIVVGELVQAWAESEQAGAAAPHADHGPLSWVETADGASGSGVIVPPEAVLRNAEAGANSGAVFVLHDDTLERRVVKLGARNADGQIILSGLSSGERVAVGDFAKLADGARVKVVER